MITLDDLRRVDAMDLEAENHALRARVAERETQIATALQHLEKGRALWNGPCHQCAYVLRDALGMGEQSAQIDAPERLTEDLLLLMTQSNQLLYAKDMAAELLALRAENRALREALLKARSYLMSATHEDERATQTIFEIDIALKDALRAPERPAEQILEERFPYLRESRP